MRLLVNHIQQGHALGGILLQAPSSTAAVFVCPSCCCSAERHRLWDLGVHTQTPRVINYFWSSFLLVAALLPGAWQPSPSFEHFSEGVLQCSDIPFPRMGSAVWMPRHWAALISFLPARCSWVTELCVPREHAHSAPGCTRIDPHFLRHSSSHVQLIARKSDENWCNSVHPAFAWLGPKCF